MARRDWGMDLHYEWLTGLNSMHHQHSAIPLNMMIANQFKPNINSLTFPLGHQWPTKLLVTRLPGWMRVVLEI